jgi:hypothetical protein
MAVSILAEVKKRYIVEVLQPKIIVAHKLHCKSVLYYLVITFAAALEHYQNTGCITTKIDLENNPIIFFFANNPII